MHFSEWDNQLFDVFNRQLSFNGLDTFALFISDYRNWWVLSFGILTLGLVFKKKLAESTSDVFSCAGRNGRYQYAPSEKTVSALTSLPPKRSCFKSGKLW